MTQLRNLVLATFAMVALLASCSKDTITEALQPDKAPPELASTQHDSLSLRNSLLTDSIIPLEVDSKLLKQQVKALSNGDYNLSNNLWQIREMQVTIRSRGGGNTGNYYLSTNGKGNELRLMNYDAGIGRPTRFFIKVLPATSGISYLIYSYFESTPIAVGQQSNNPNNKVLFTLPNESGSLFSASWDIFNATNNTGYLVIQSQSYTGQGSGGWMDIFYHVIEARNDNKLGFGKYQQSAAQEFIITPAERFTLENIKYVNDYSASVIPRENLAVTSTYTNSKSTYEMYDMVFQKDISEYSSFTENKGISFNIYGLSNTFKRPSALLDQIKLDPGDDVKADALYTSYQQITRKVSSVLPLNIPPRTKVDITYFFKAYDLEADYEATLRYSDREPILTGRWKGRVHVDELPASEHIYKLTNMDTGVITRVRVQQTKATRSNRINF